MLFRSALSSFNYGLLKDTPDTAHFKLEISEVIDSPVCQEEKEERKSSFGSLIDNCIILSEEEADDAPEKLPKLVHDLVKQGHKEIIVDLTGFFLVTPPIIQTLILESLNLGGSLKVRITDVMEEILAGNPQCAMLNFVVVKEGGADEGPSTKTQAVEKTEIVKGSDDFSPSFYEEDSGPIDERPEDISEKTSASLDHPVEDDGKPSLFQIEASTLRVGEMSAGAFLRDFPSYFKQLFSAGQQLYVDMSDYERLEKEVICRLLMATYEAVERGRKLTICLLKDQQEIMKPFIPQIEQVEKRKDTTPRFTIVGSRMEVHHVSPELFMDKFPEHFKKLMACGQSKLVVDISHLKDFSGRSIDLLVLSYLEAVGRGFTLTYRIRPEMEEDFRKSGRGRSLPLEIIKPELSSKMGIYERKYKPAIDMSKITGVEDRLTQKVIDHQYESISIESRGTFQNWEPSPVKGEEREVVYKGAERRVEKRYKSPNLEVIFARGSIAKISGRRYPMHNLSQSGACFTCAVSLTKNEALRMKIYYTEDFSVEVGAKVIWTKPVPSQALFKVGVQFTKMSELVKTQVREIISKLYGQS